MPEPITTEIEQGAFRYHALNFEKAGQNSFDSPPGQDPDMFERLENVMPPKRGALERRWGTNLWTTTPFAVRRFVEYQSDATLVRRLLACNNSSIRYFSEAGVDQGLVKDLTGGAAVPWLAVSRDTVYGADSVQADLFQWDPVNGARAWGIVAPSLSPSVTPGAANSGHISCEQGRRYYMVFRDSVLNHYSDLSPISNSTGVIEMKNVVLGSLQVSTDPRVDRKVILATADGEDASVLYWVADIPNAQTSFTDDMPEDDLLIQNVYLETDDQGIEHGVAGNQPPPNGTLLGMHAGRLIMIVGGQYLRASKSHDECVTSTGAITGRFEECWPPEYEMDISPGSEAVSAWMSDGNSIWLGTEKHVRRIAGNSPYNWETPELAFNSVGVLNQDVWKVVYLEGTPMGSMWLTPDFRVIGSDFNNYQDVGAPVQDILDSIQRAQASKCHAMTLATGAYNLYVLAVPTGTNTDCDTLLVYDLKLRKWYVWKPNNPSSALHSWTLTSGQVLALMGLSTTGVHQFASTNLSDYGNLNIPVLLRTSWLHMGDPQARKLLQELEVLTDCLNMAVTIDGASMTSEFDSPSVVVEGAPLVASPLGEYKVYLAGKVSKDRFYRLTFQSVRNYLRDTENFTASSWGLSGVIPTVTADVTAAPDDLTSADRIEFHAGAGQYSNIAQFVTLPFDLSNRTFTFSVYLRVDAPIDNQVFLSLRYAGGNFDVLIPQVTTDWKRYSVTGTLPTVTDRLVGAMLYTFQNSPTVYIWGAQLELGPAVNSYIRPNNDVQRTVLDSYSLEAVPFHKL